MSTFQLKIKRAGILLALFLSAQGAWAETSKEVVDQAYGLVLQKERPAALALLRQSLKKNPNNKDVQLALEDISSLFLSDKAQQTFELAISLKGTDLNAALQKMNEALRLESDNQSIGVEMARIQLASNDCSGAQKTLLHAKEGNPSSELLSLHQSQVDLCQGHFENIETLRPTDWKRSKLSSYWALVEIEHQFKSNKPEAALTLITEFQAKAGPKTPLVPEFYYWQWKAKDLQKESDDAAANQYVSECHKLSARLSREMAPEPHLCRHTPEVENFLKKSHNPEP